MPDIDLLSTVPVERSIHSIEWSIRVVLAQSSTDSQEELRPADDTIALVDLTESTPDHIDRVLKLRV